mgnify:CR=1 FL=1
MGKIGPIAEEVIAFARRLFGEDFVPLHRPVFEGNERLYLVLNMNKNWLNEFTPFAHAAKLEEVLESL